jgi:hypothetical protein
MKKTQRSISKRTFIRQSVGLALSAFALPVFAKSGSSLQTIHADNTSEIKPPIAGELVFEFVRMAHGNMDRVKEMIEKDPRLVNACWDWGGGDFETALGGASHMGNKSIANYLLDHGARKDIFCAAMMGDISLVTSFVKSDPGIVNTKGPHEYSLLYHVAISGDIDMASVVKPHIIELPETFNGALHAAVRSGNVPMTEWLLSNGVSNVNSMDVFGNTAFQSAEKKGNKEIAALLKKNGGK